MMEMEVERMKVAELRSLLAERGLEESGKKADLVERLKEAMTSGQEKDMLDKHKKDNSKEGSANGKEGSEEESDESEDDEDEEASNERDEAGEGPLIDDKGLKSIESREFVAKKPEGVSFGLHTPKIKRPQLNLPVPPIEAPVEVASYNNSICTSNVINTHETIFHAQNQDSAVSSRRPGAAAFFGDGSGGNTTVPLPPSAGYSLEESDGEEEEPPPGTEPIGVMQVWNFFFEKKPKNLFVSDFHPGEGRNC